MAKTSKNVPPVSRMPNAVPQLKEWVKVLVSQRLYFERARELSKGWWEVCNHGLSKDIAMRPPSGDEYVSLESPAPRQSDEKKRKMAPSSLTQNNSEKKKPKKRSCKPKGSTDTLPTDLVHQLREESEEEEDKFKLVAGVQAGVVIQGPSEPAGAKIERSRHEEVNEEVLAEEELTQHEAEVRVLTEKRDTYKLLSKKLQAELEAAQREHVAMAERHKWSRSSPNSDCKRENLGTGQENRGASISIELSFFGKDNLAKKLKADKSKVVKAKTEADAKVDQFKIDVEAIHAQAKSMVDYAKWQARRESLEGVHAQNFYVLAELESAKVEEARARKLAFPEEDSESLSEFEDGEDPEDEDVASDGNQDT
ncbi:uncharacterized protein [Nicotiana sylvestris]|uniref:uncharacterized protein n=1 Tax=Nicotiana sylvestris TaxID=4096 RepID=UPI00388CBB6D